MPALMLPLVARMARPLFSPAQHSEDRTARTPPFLQRHCCLRSQRERRTNERQPKMGAKVHPGGKKPPMTGNEAHVFVKSPNAQRAQQLCQIAERCGFASSIHPDTDKCLEELGQLMKDNRVLPSAIIVDIYDENGDGMVDEDEMRVTQRRFRTFPNFKLRRRRRRDATSRRASTRTRTNVWRSSDSS